MPESDSIIDYEKLLTVVGRYIQREHLTQICVLEVQGGVVVQGLVPAPSGEGVELIMRTQTFDRSALRDMMRGAKGA